MPRTIYQIREDNTLQPMNEQLYLTEAQFQELLERYPDLLAGDQIDLGNPRRWVLVSREMGVPSDEDGGGRWSLDHLFLDQDGIPTLVEVKRGTDSRIRREVVGQMLDYAANAIVYWPLEVLQAKFEATCQAQGKEPLGVLADLLASCDESVGDELAWDDFWSQVKTNLQAGRVRLLFVADTIPPELRRIVEFLNAQMDPAEVLAVEIKRYVGQDIQTLVPNVLGHSSGSDKRKPPVATRRWDEASFLAELERRSGAEDAAVAGSVLRWAERQMPAIWWGQGTKMGGFIPGISERGIWHQLIEVWTYGKVEIQFQYMRSRSDVFNDEPARLELLHRLNEIQGVNIPDGQIEARPPIELSVLRLGNNLSTFLSVLDWAVDLIRAGPDRRLEQP
jgi:hypothetical protein